MPDMSPRFLAFSLSLLRLRLFDLPKLFAQRDGQNPARRTETVTGGPFSPGAGLDTSPESGPLSGFVDGHGVEHSGIIPEYRGVPLHIGVPLFGGDVNGRVGVA